MSANTEFKVNNDSCTVSYNKGFDSYEVVVTGQNYSDHIEAAFDAIHEHAASLGKEYPGNLRVSISLSSFYSKNPDHLLQKLSIFKNCSTGCKILRMQSKCLGANRDSIVYEVTFCNKFVMPFVATSIGGSFGVVMTEDKSRVLVISQLRADGSTKNQQPGGAWSYGEDPVTTCIREVQEETGLSLDVIMNSNVRLLKQRWQSNARPGGVADCMVKFLIIVSNEFPDSTTLKPQSEDHVTAARWVPVSEIESEYKLYLDGEETAKTITAQGVKGENPYKKNGAYRDDFLCDVMSVLNGHDGFRLRITQKGDKVNVEL